MSQPVGRLHLITDTVLQSRYSHAELAELGIAGGADTVQYRSKSGDIRRMIAEASEVGDVCRSAGVPFLVNDRIDVALAVGADGVHLGREDMPIAIARRLVGHSMILGGTVRSVDHLLEAEREGADYVGLGPVFNTTSKEVGMAPLGIERVREVCRSAHIPVICIAGITAENAGDVIQAGAWGVAILGAIAKAPDVAVATGDILNAIGLQRT
jgi:thiamine-phosphate pyrophosphorylase